MPPRLNIFTAHRALPLRPLRNLPPGPTSVTRRSYASDPSKVPPAEGKDAVGPNMQQAEHVSEEAAKMAKITGQEGPDLSQGTPVQEILKEEPETRKDAPQVIKDSIKSKTPAPKPQTRPFSTMARRREEIRSVQSDDISIAKVMDAAGLETLQDPTVVNTSSQQGHKFGFPTLPLPSNLHKDYRYDPVIKQMTNLMMRHGKLAEAQRSMSFILQYLRTSSPPTYNPSRPLLPGAPPASHLPLNPVLYVTLAIDSIAPLLRIRNQKGAAGGGVALQIPVPLGVRQRRRQAFMWLLDSAEKRPSRGSGRNQFATRVAEEIVSIIEGRSSIWERRQGVHKLATAARINLKFSRRPGR